MCWTPDLGLWPDWPASHPALPLFRERSLDISSAAWDRWPLKTCVCSHQWVTCTVHTCTLIWTHTRTKKKNNVRDHLSKKYGAQQVTLNKFRLLKGKTNTKCSSVCHDPVHCFSLCFSLGYFRISCVAFMLINFLFLCFLVAVFSVHLCLDSWRVLSF